MLPDAIQIERWPIDRLLPYVANARSHPETQIAQIAGSIAEFGFNVPCLVDERGVLIAGHGRLLAAMRLGLSDIPVIRLGHLSDAQARAFRIADNKLALNAGWDMSLLAAEIGDLQGAGFDMALAGFSAQELAALAVKNGGLTDPDDTPEPAARAVTVLGDVWILGGHRLVCGDSTQESSVAACLGQERPHLMVTDPPYGVNYDAAWRTRAGVGSKTAAVGKVLNDDRADWRDTWALFPGSVAYIWHAGTFAGAVAASMQATKFNIRAQIVWVKTRLVLSRGDYHHQHEPCFYGVREGEDDHWHFVPEHEIATYAVKAGQIGQYRGGRKQSTVWNIEHIKSETGHSTQKPVECMRRPIENNSAPGDAVYEPFSGSGTTIIAAEQTGRRCLAIELNPLYVDVAIKRWQAFTGKQATLQATGQSFEDVADARYDFRKDGLGSWEEWCAFKRKELIDARAQAAS